MQAFLVLFLCVLACTGLAADDDIKDDFLVNPARSNAATFVRGSTAYVWGGEGTESTPVFRDIVPYFNAINVNDKNQTVTYRFVENSRDYQNFSTGASAILHPNNDSTVYFFGGYRQTAAAIPENNSMYLEQYNFETAEWASVEYEARLLDGTPAAAPVNRAYFTAITTKGLIYLSGGIGTGENATTDGVLMWMFDPASNVFTPVTQIDPAFEKSSSAVALSDGRVVYIPAVCELVYVFDPEIRSMTVQPVQNYDHVLGGDLLSSNASESSKTPRSQGYTYIDVKDQGIFYLLGWSDTMIDEPELNAEFQKQYAGNNISYSSYGHGESIYPGGYKIQYHGILKLDTSTWTWGFAESGIKWVGTYGGELNASVAILNSHRIFFAYGCIKSVCSRSFWVLDWLKPRVGPFKPFMMTSIQRDTYSSYENFTWVLRRLTYIIVGVSSIFGYLLVLSWLLWRQHIRKYLGAAFSFVFWDRRVGEPKWAELSHLTSKIVLSFVFCAYLVYSIDLVITSPISTISIRDNSVDYILAPDMRFCFKGALNISLSCGARYNGTVSPSTSCTNQGLTKFSRSKRYPYSSYDSLHFNTDCWLFRAGKEPYNIQSPLDFFYTFETDNLTNTHSMQIAFYPRGQNPNVPVYFYNDLSTDYLTDLNGYYDSYFDKDETPPTLLQRSQVLSWAEEDMLNNPGPNQYVLDLNTVYPIFSYQMQDHRYMTDSGWNRIGFASVYNNTPEVMSTYETSVPDYDTMDLGDRHLISIRPSEMVTVTIEDRYIYTIVSVLGPVGGLLSLLITLDSCLFGTRPKSHWGIIHRIPSKKVKTSLHQKLYDKFGFLERSLPFVNPVDEQLFKDKRMLADHRLRSIPATHHAAAGGAEKHEMPAIADDRAWASIIVELQKELAETRAELSSFKTSSEEKVYKLTSRMQLQELILKDYYIDDELIQALDDAYDNDSVTKNASAVVNKKEHKPFENIRSRMGTALTWRFRGRRKEKSDAGDQDSIKYMELAERSDIGSNSNENSQFIKLD